MISIETFIEIRERFGHFASWAVWAEEGEKAKGNIDDLTVLNPDENPTLLETLHGNSIFLGLNISRRIELPFGNFHDPRSRATDFKIRYALKNTSYWGSYITDIIKDFEERASGKMISFLRKNKEFERDNIRKLHEEIAVLGFANPTLVTDTWAEIFGLFASLITQITYPSKALEPTRYRAWLSLAVRPTVAG